MNLEVFFQSCGYTWSLPLALVCIIGGYLFGNLQTAIFISQKKYKDDVRTHGSGNAGTTNMIRVYGVKPGLFTFAGDFLKGVLAVLLGRLLMGSLGGYLAGMFAVLGHCFPVIYGFRGGKGVAASFGIAWVASAPCAAITTAAIVIAFLLWKRISVCSLIGMVVYLTSAILLRPDDPMLAVLAFVLLVLVYVRHKDNIVRLIRGEEKTIIK